MRRVFTYAARCGEFVKVGRAGQIMSRIQTLQIGNPLHIELHGYCEGDVERDAHEHLEACGYKRVRGEWFRWEPGIEQALAGVGIWPLGLRCTTKFTGKL